MSTYYNKKEKTTMQKADIENKLELCIESFKSVLYEKDETFLENMAKSNMDQGNLACTACGSCLRKSTTSAAWMC